MSGSAKPVEEMERAELEEQVRNFRKMKSALSERMECPVCLTVPRKGPVPCCPRGHLICQPCHKRMKEEMQRNCPTCRGPMGEGKNLLARAVIENLDHLCDLAGCKQLVPFQELERHREKCEFRQKTDEKKIAIALYDFTRERESQLSFQRENLLMVEPSSKKWLFAKKGKVSGWVPGNYILILDGMISEKEAIKDYLTEGDNDLSFQKGEMIQIYKEHLGWGIGKKGEEIGYFPLNYVAT